MTYLMALIALLPIIWLVIALAVLKLPGYIACGITFVITALLALFVYGMKPLDLSTATLEGILHALWPICLVIVAALFAYHLVVKTGAMEKIKLLLLNVSNDKRILVLLIAWAFSTFMEGMAGFGTSVAIPVAMLLAFDFDPFAVVLACLISNTIPTCFGSVGIPTLTLAGITNLDAVGLSGNIAVMECLLTFITPFLIVAICNRGIKAIKGRFFLIFASSLGFLIPWMLLAIFVGPQLPNIIGSIVCIFVTIFASKISKKEIPEEYRISPAKDREKSSTTAKNKQANSNLSQKNKVGLVEGLVACAPFIIIFILCVYTSKLVPPIHNILMPIKTQMVIYTGPNPAKLTFSWIITPGVIIFIAAIIGGFIQKASLKTMGRVFLDVLSRYYKTILTICSIMAVAKIMGYSPMITDIATALVLIAGPVYPFLSPVIGVLGGFITSSGTSSCLLFGQLQVHTAQILSLNQSWIASANVVGAGIGKMLCPQNITIGASVADKLGQESKILKKAFPYFLVYTVSAGVFCYLGSLLF